GYVNIISSKLFFFFQAEDGIRDLTVTGVQTCALPISDHDGRPAGLRQDHHHRKARAPHGPARQAQGADGLARRLPSGRHGAARRSEERRVGKEGRSRWWLYHLRKKNVER